MRARSDQPGGAKAYAACLAQDFDRAWSLVAWVPEGMTDWRCINQEECIEHILIGSWRAVPGPGRAITTLTFEGTWCGDDLVKQVEAKGWRVREARLVDEGWGPRVTVEVIV